jgi:hypothetical protein
MILIDLNQVMISNLMMQVSKNGGVIEEDLIRHMVLNSLRGYKQKFASDYGEIVICADDRKYWRKDVFPYYKQGRKKDREASPYDWKMIFDTLNKVKEEIKENFPYKVMQVEGAEADDIIGTIVHKYGTHLMNDSTEKLLILSSDKDFMQLQKFMNVDQYSPMQKKFLRTNNAEEFLKEHIMKGDRGDGIPNYLSEDSVFVTGGRQKPLGPKKIEKIIDLDPDQFCANEFQLRNYSRNELLIDLSKIPSELKERVLNMFDTYKTNPRSKVFDYLVKNRMKHLLEVIQEF